MERAPGRWFWGGQLGREGIYGRNAVGLRLSCMRPGWGQTTVMDFKRAGMSGAVPRFLGPGVGLQDAREVAQYEQTYRDEVNGIDNPLATYIAAADPATVLELLDLLDAAEAQLEAIVLGAGPSQPELIACENCGVGLDEGLHHAETLGRCIISPFPPGDPEWTEPTQDVDAILTAIHDGKLLNINRADRGAADTWLGAINQDADSLRYWIDRGCSFRWHR